MVIKIKGIPLYYEQRGSGKPLLLLHGWMGNAQSWAPLLRDYSSNRAMIAVDFPGQGGRTPEPPEPWSVTEHMEMIAELMRKLHIEGADIVAHSFGGRVSILLAATYPELVGKMVLTGCAGLIPKRTAKKNLRNTCYKLLRGLIDGPLGRMMGERRTERLREALRQRFGSADYKALTPSMRATFNRVVTQDLRPYLSKIRASTLLIWGKNDDSTPLWMGRVMEAEIPDAGLVVFEDAGHFAYLDKYQDFQTIVKHFIG